MQKHETRLHKKFYILIFIYVYVYSVCIRIIPSGVVVGIGQYTYNLEQIEALHFIFIGHFT